MHFQEVEYLHLPVDEENGAAYNQGVEAVIALNHQTDGQLAARVQALEGQVERTTGIVENRLPVID